MTSLLLVGVILPILIGGAFVLGRFLRYRLRDQSDLTPVSKQHLDLYRGGQLAEPAVEAAKARFRHWLDRGEVERVESSLRAGTQFVIRVRALTEIGSDEAGQILERQLSRKLTDDEVEQAWYWIDLASSLRSLNREESLPLLLDCVAVSDDFPLVHYFAAETICFLGFSGYLGDLQSTHGRAALRVLHRTLEGLRFGVPPQMVPEARLGEMVERLWDDRPGEPDPLLTRIFVEVLRQLRRMHELERAMSEEPFELEAFQLQMARMSSLEQGIEDYLQDAKEKLPRQLPMADANEQPDLLAALEDLKADAASFILPLLNDPEFEHKEQATCVLRWSKHEGVGPLLRGWVQRTLPMSHRGMKRLRPWPPGHSSVPDDFPYHAILFALRGHASPQTEQLLLTAAHDWDPTFRGTAIGSLGWWEPFQRAEVLLHLQDARFDPCADVRHAARAALARLGERQALQWFRQALHSDNRQRAFEAMQTVAQENLTLLWPDLDEQVESDDPELAYVAREALEQMQEELDHRMGW